MSSREEVEMVVPEMQSGVGHAGMGWKIGEQRRQAGKRTVTVGDLEPTEAYLHDKPGRTRNPRGVLGHHPSMEHSSTPSHESVRIPGTRVATFSGILIYLTGLWAGICHAGTPRGHAAGGGRCLA